eukprot:8068525-Alexandrium_andersonii.AAC.1
MGSAPNAFRLWKLDAPASGPPTSPLLTAGPAVRTLGAHGPWVRALRGVRRALEAKSERAFRSSR